MARKAREVADYPLGTRSGTTRLSRLFGRHKYLVVLHNMGQDCPTCAIFGDEYNGMRKHLERVAGLCVVSPDDPRTQAAYARKRGWSTRMYSGQGSDFIKGLGFEDKRGHAQPGVSVLAKAGGRITLIGQVNVMKDRRCPSVLETLWMIPGADTSKLARRRA
jgi:predicted dithiol-disulfide oxidoreductase (DUF899 family)